MTARSARAHTAKVYAWIESKIALKLPDCGKLGLVFPRLWKTITCPKTAKSLVEKAFNTCRKSFLNASILSSFTRMIFAPIFWFA